MIISSPTIYQQITEFHSSLWLNNTSLRIYTIFS
jgi:hypothetical protein